ncbi:DUF3618 domain-containing protein [Streptomyces sp. NPDC002734]|uniref:DUF3618 domain-containing protein n=1 Tax=Streptomyces sp. NPDC002734 TaxID=3154426 RepID=UPI0033225489
MSNTHTHHHTHAGPHGPHCEDELRRDVEVKREELGHTVEELASRADVKARARTKLRETKQQAEARRADLKTRALQAKQRIGSASAEEETTAYRPVMPPAPGTSGTTDTGAYRVDQKEEGFGSRKPLIAAGGAAALAACAAGVMLRKGSRSPMGGHSAIGGRHMGRHTMGRRTMGGHRMGRHATGGHRMAGSTLSKFTAGRTGTGSSGGHAAGSLGMRSMASMGALKSGKEMLKGRSTPTRSTPTGRMHLPGGHGNVPGGSTMRGMALKKGAAMAGGAPLVGAKIAQQGVRKGGTLMHAGARGGGHSATSGLRHSLAHTVTPDQGMGHRLEHAMGHGHHRHGPKGLWH